MNLTIITDYISHICCFVTGSLLMVCKSELLSSDLCLQCFDAVGWAAGRASGL